MSGDKGTKRVTLKCRRCHEKMTERIMGDGIVAMFEPPVFFCRTASCELYGMLTVAGELEMQTSDGRSVPVSDRLEVADKL